MVGRDNAIPAALLGEKVSVFCCVVALVGLLLSDVAAWVVDLGVVAAAGVAVTGGMLPVMLLVCDDVVIVTAVACDWVLTAGVVVIVIWVVASVGDFSGFRVDEIFSLVLLADVAAVIFVIVWTVFLSVV